MEKDKHSTSLDLHIGLQLLQPAEKDRLFRYLALKDFGRRVVPEEKKLYLLQLLEELAKEEHLYELDFVARLRRLSQIKEQAVKTGGKYLAFFEY